MKSIFSNIPADLPRELTETICAADSVRIERIVSAGHASPPDFWYDQNEHEWVLLLSGAARLRFEYPRGCIEMKAGDFVNIPMHQRHRVEWTDESEPTIWLAVFYR